MKHIAVVLIMLTYSSFMQAKSNKETFGKILSRSYDSIRIEMVKTACAIKGINDSAFLAEMSGGRVDSTLVNSSQKISNGFIKIFQESNKMFLRENLDKQDSLARFLRANIMGRLLMLDYEQEAEVISRFGLHKKSLDSLFHEASDYLKAKEDRSFSDFYRKYPNSKFCSLIPSKAKTDKAKGNQLFYIVLGVFLTLGILTIVAYLMYALQKKNKELKALQPQPNIPVDKPKDVPNDLGEQSADEKQKFEEKEDEHVEEEQVDDKNLNAFAECQDGWTVVGASVIGNSHISMNLPCQDNWKYTYIRNGWGIAITSDGAGSAEHSDIGSHIVVERGIHYFRSIVEQKNWIENDTLPSEAEWISIAFSTLKAVRDDIEKFAAVKKIEYKSLSATAIVVIHTPRGFLTTHVGDGRAGYLDRSSEWKPLIVPHKGEEANQTIFLTSDFWNLPYYLMSRVMVPESHVIPCNPKAFTLMSDGCEHTSWKCYTRNDETGVYCDPNMPHTGFFNAIINQLSEGITAETNKKWARFLQSGNTSFANEPDDKTMIVGVLKQ